jgi:Rrf2 family protein
MLFSAKAEYACLAMLELAAQDGKPKPVRLADIADKHGIPQRFLVQILLQLKGAGLVISTRGAAGGYQLARDRDQITLAEILDVVEQAEPEPTARLRELPQTVEVQALAHCWQKAIDAQRAVLERSTLAFVLGLTPDYAI